MLGVSFLLIVGFIEAHQLMILRQNIDPRKVWPNLFDGYVRRCHIVLPRIEKMTFFRDQCQLRIIPLFDDKYAH